MVNWIFVTGGVLSGLGKGLTSASIAKLLQSRGYKVTPIKCDGYLNVDPGTMNPVEHGEVFVQSDGGEVDMDFGHYERFLNIKTKFKWNLTSGKVFKEVIEKEREGEFLGQTVQMIPHVTDEVKKRLRNIAEEEGSEIVIVEIGGTVGDMENQLFLEATRQMESEENSIHIHLTLVPYLETVGEQKTKPTQHSVKELRELGLKPDIIIGRSKEKLDESTKEKISLFCDVGKENVVSNPDINNIYKLPLIMKEEGIDEQVSSLLDLDNSKESGMSRWEKLVENLESPDKKVEIGICGKYTGMNDSYASIEEALKHAGAGLKTGVETELISTENIDERIEKLKEKDGIIIPGGFGTRGVDGKIKVAEFCRENKIPLLGICFGMQMMVVEYARNVCGLQDANSTEIDGDAGEKVVKIMDGQKSISSKGGTMRLGSYKSSVKDGTYLQEIYGKEVVTERHRHRFEVNPEYHSVLEENGLIISGTSKNGLLAEFIEIEDHPFYIGTQAHPEFKSYFERPNPLYKEFLKVSGRD